MCCALLSIAFKCLISPPDHTRPDGRNRPHWSQGPLLGLAQDFARSRQRSPISCWFTVPLLEASKAISVSCPPHASTPRPSCMLSICQGEGWGGCCRWMFLSHQQRVEGLTTKSGLHPWAWLGEWGWLRVMCSHPARVAGSTHPLPSPIPKAQELHLTGPGCLACVGKLGKSTAVGVPWTSATH